MRAIKTSQIIHDLMNRITEVIDLTHTVNVDLFRLWDQKEVAYMDQLRMVRISSASPEVVVVSQPGRHAFLAKKVESAPEESEQMDEDEVPLLLEPPSRFSSTMMTMDQDVLS